MEWIPKSVPVSSLQVGQKILRNGEWLKIYYLERLTSGTYHIDGQRDYDGGSSICLSFNETEFVQTMVPYRACAPCYDSDCECVFDMVG